MITAYSVWPLFACLAVLLAFAQLPIFASADAPPGLAKARISSIDGLRGFLALAVFFHHGTIYHAYLSGVRWDFPPSRFYAVLGPLGVAFFFMITGYLFWSRLIADGGRPNWFKLYVGRLFRIAPLYLAAVAVMFVLVAWKTGFALQVPPLQLGKEVAKWLMLGLAPGVNVNGLGQTSDLTAGVTWSLQYEWAFYFSLPILAFAARGPRTHLAFAVLALLASLALAVSEGGDGRTAHPSTCGALFAAGMICGSLQARGLTPRLPDALSSILCLLLVAVVFLAFDGVLQAAAIAILGLAFLLVVSGASLFGLLRWRACRRLGDVSYSIYLLHGLVLATLFSFAAARGYFLSSPLAHWTVVMLAGLVVVALSAATHRWIEMPGIALGRRVAAFRSGAPLLRAPSAGE